MGNEGAAAGLGLDEIVAVLATGADRLLSPGVGVSQLDHALQTAALVRRREPDDGELAVAGLVHDLGQLLPAARDETHAADGAAAVRATLGERVAGIVALHVEAKRYLVATEGNYKVSLSGDSVASLRPAGRGPWRRAGEGLPGQALGGRRGDPAAGRRRRQGRRPGGWRPREVGTSSATSVRAGRGIRRPGQRSRRLTTVGRRPDVRSGQHPAGGVHGDERRERRGVPRRGAGAHREPTKCLAGGIPGPATAGRSGGSNVAGCPARGARTGQRFP